jgi:hypothetical protein
MAIWKNVTSQKVPIFAFDQVAGAAETGDAGNITAQISIDGGSSAAVTDTNPTELDATNQAGVYLFDLTQAETNGNLIVITATSSTANVVIEPLILFTTVGDGTRVAVDTQAISGDTTAADNLEAAFDGTGSVTISADLAGTTQDFTTALTEAYANDNATFTPAQALYMLWSALAEFSIATTTITAKKLDGSTTAMTFTLDDASNPTSRTRAT